ncbi:MAG TPA: hypothetical protein VH136_02235 [Trebonia sp.]|nr:hypothetical protein [Trebonia sp.]
MSMVDVRDVTRTYGSGPTATAALRGVTFTVGEGQLVALRGRSGSARPRCSTSWAGSTPPTAARCTWPGRT